MPHAIRFLALAAALTLAAVPGAAAADDGPECKSDYGQTACGYHCVSDYGQVRCAQTPAGACEADYGQVTCWDPPRWVSREGGPQASCLSDYGQTACGYDCVADYGQVRCASTPDGVCQANYGQVTCSD
jgi:hypothetical protein